MKLTCHIYANNNSLNFNEDMLNLGTNYCNCRHWSLNRVEKSLEKKRELNLGLKEKKLKNIKKH